VDENLAQEEITDEQYAVWLERYGAIFMFHHLGQNYIYRRLNRREYRAVMAIDDEVDRTEEVVQSCLLYPRGWKAASDLVQFGLAGIPDVLCEQILRSSGIINMGEVFENYKNVVASDIEAQMEATIDHVFSGGASFGRYQDWSHDQLFEAYARAEWVLVSIEGKNIVAKKEEAPKKPVKRSPEEMAKRREELQKIHDEQKQGSNTKTKIDGALDQFESDRMALKPIGEVVQRFQKTQILQQKRNAMKAANRSTQQE
jgi:hypothetical protein